MSHFISVLSQLRPLFFRVNLVRTVRAMRVERPGRAFPGGARSWPYSSERWGTRIPGGRSVGSTAAYE